MLTIATFNIQNLGLKNKENKAKADIIYKYLKNKRINILNLQEVYFSLEQELLNLLNDKFDLYGDYRFSFKMPYNEKVPVITNKKIIEYNTYQLPHFPSFTKRVLTKVVLEYRRQKITVLNTHLDYKRNKVKERELKKILKLIKKEENLIILTGDFNLKTNNPIFKAFIKELKKLNISLISLQGKTFKPSISNKPIDHIFISDKFKVISKEIIKDIKISDHYPVMVKLELKSKQKN